MGLANRIERSPPTERCAPRSVPHSGRMKPVTEFPCKVVELPDKASCRTAVGAGVESMPATIRCRRSSSNCPTASVTARSLAICPGPVEGLSATPRPPVAPQRFLLGASVESALLAAAHQWEFVFARHLKGDDALLDDTRLRPRFAHHWSPQARNLRGAVSGASKSAASPSGSAR